MSEKIAEELSEVSEESENKPSAAEQTFERIKVFVSSLAYIVMIFIVIFGMSDGVYQGFPNWVPYVIIALFLLMAFVRMYQGIIGEIPDKKEKKKKNKKQKKDEDTEEQ